MLWVVALSWIEIGGLMRSITKAQLAPSKPLQFTTVSKPYHHHTHIFFLETPPSPSRFYFVSKSRMDDGWEVFLRPQWTAPPRRLGLILQGLGEFCHFLLVAHSPWVSSRRCSSFRFFNDTLNLMNKRLQIFRFDHGGNATKRLQCHNLLTPNLLWLIQNWCH